MLLHYVAKVHQGKELVPQAESPINEEKHLEQLKKEESQELTGIADLDFR